MRPIRAALIDIDGVLTVSWKPLPGGTRIRSSGRWWLALPVAGARCIAFVRHQHRILRFTLMPRVGCVVSGAGSKAGW